MIIKGCKKHFVVVKGLGSDYIDEAYLVLKNDVPKCAASGDIVKEATRIITEYQTAKKRKRLPFSFPSFLLGVLLAGVIAGILFVFV